MRTASLQESIKKLKRSINSHNEGNKRHTEVLTCAAPSQLDHKAICQVSFSVRGHLGVAALVGPNKKVRYGGQVRVNYTGQGKGRLRWVGRGDTVGGLQEGEEHFFVVSFYTHLHICQWIKISFSISEPKPWYWFPSWMWVPFMWLNIWGRRWFWERSCFPFMFYPLKS